MYSVMSRCCCCFELWWRRNASLLHFSVARCSFVFFSYSLFLSRLGVSMLFFFIFPVSRRVTFIVIIVVDSTGDTRYTKPIYFTFFHVSVVNKKWTFKFPFYVHTASQQQHSERELRWKFSRIHNFCFGCRSRKDVVGTNKWPAFSHLTNKR